MSAKITDLTTIVGAGVASTDVLVIVDVSDATMAASGTDKKVSVDDLRIGMGALTQAAADGLYYALGATAAAAIKLATSRNINGVAFDGTAAITVPAAASTLIGTTIAAGIVTSSLTAVGTITSGVWTGTAIAIANGGTGQITAALAINALLPSQTSNSGKYLTTDGSVASWATVSASDATKLPLAGGTMTGNLLFSADNTRDIGASAATRPRTGYFATSVVTELIQSVGTPLYVRPSNSIGLRVVANGSSFTQIDADSATFWLGGNCNTVHLGSGKWMNVQTTLVRMDSGNGLGWGSGAAQLTATDTGFHRNGAGVVEINNGTAGTFRDLKLRDLIINGATNLLRTSAALTDNAGASAGTLANAPSVGNPTKWVRIDDAGTARFLPLW